jgi:DNA-directed RNA polymerase subunit RPC12/RpoP
MHVTRAQIVARGITNRCPNCGGKTLFKPGKLFEVNPTCPNCGLKIERDEGSFLGAIALNFGTTVVVFLVPVLLLYLGGVFSGLTASIVAGVGAFGFPILFYRSSRSFWLMNYYFVLPQHLPANQAAPHSDEDENI